MGKLRWIATRDNRTRDAHADMDGVAMPKDEPFVVDGEELMFPGDISLGASGKNVCNCRCTVLYFIHEPGKEVKQPPKIEIDEDLLPESTKYVKVRTNNIRVIDDYRSNENDYNIAEKGGRHHGELETFKKEGEYQINKAIRHFKETIDLHKEWINNPLIKYPDWNTFSKEDKKIKLTKWVKDIERNTEQMHIAKSYYVRIKKWQK